MNLEEYINKLQKYYHDGVSYSTSKYDKEILKQIPKQLEELYSQYGDISLPFGEIYSIDKAIEISKRSPFKEDDWFCFGQDYYFSFWLCKKGATINDFAFTVWDHETETNIEEPCFITLEKVLDYLSDEYDNSELDMCNVTITDCDSQGLKDLMTIKRIFSSPLSVSDIKTQISNAECIIKDNINLYEANRILSEHQFEHIAVSVNRISDEKE